MPRIIARTTLLLSALVVATPRPGLTQSFYDASSLLPPHNGDIALGASVVDVNADGLVDLYRRNRLYLQHPEGRFKDVFEEVGYEARGGASFGALFADANNDGFVETFFMDLEENLPYYLGRNGIRFDEHSNDSGIRSIEIVQGSVWTDFNRDGLLDLFVGIDGGTPRLYRNVGLDFFQNVAAVSGFDYRLAYGAAAADYDRDGDPDIMLTQCFPAEGDTLQQNILWRNTDGVFENVSDELGIVDDLPSWGVVWLDYDNDGLLDFYVGNFPRPSNGKPGTNTLYRNLGDAGFEDVTAAAGVARDPTSQSIAVAAADFDNDGWIDIFVADAHELQPAFFRNNGDGTFTDRWPKLALPTVHSTAVAVGDVNGDGWIDIFHPSLGSDQLLLNLGGDNHFLMVSLRGTTSNHFGVGGRIDVHAGGLHQVREITAGDGMTSQNHNLSAHFGLGTASVADSVIVHWPSGVRDRIDNVPSNRFVTIVEGVGVNNPPAPFELLSPVEDVVASHSESLPFTWTESTDAEDPVSYSLYVYGPGLDSTVAKISNGAYTFDRSIFRDGETYRWTVSATDGYSVRAARSAAFVFGPTTVVDPTELPEDVLRFDIYPNPFVTTTRIEIETGSATDYALEILDVLGRRLEVLHEGRLPSGEHRFEWDGSNFTAGIYVIRLIADEEQATRTVVRAK